MALSNYSELVAAIHGFLNRADMATVAPTLIALAEAEFNRTLRAMDMEMRAYAVLEDRLPVPAGFAGLRAINIGNDAPLDQVTPEELERMGSCAGSARYFALDGNELSFWPQPASGTVTITYYAKIPALTVSAPTNWLLTSHPDLYLFAALAQAEFYNWNDDRLPIVKARTEELIEQINAETRMKRYGNRTLTARAPASQQVRGVRT